MARLLRRTWTPVGVGGTYKTRAEFDRVLRYLAADDTGRRAVATMDGPSIGSPGFAGLRIYTTTARHAAL